jgi:hypothetical protein
MDIQLKITKTVPVQFRSKGRFFHKDGIRSWHDWGYVLNTDTGEELGLGIESRTKKGDSTAFALNKKDFDYASRPGSKCKWVCCNNSVTQKQFAIPMERAIQLVQESVDTIGIQEPNSNVPYYLITIEQITGEKTFEPF